MKVHTDPDAWKGSFNLAVQVYNAVRGFPVEEKYCLGAQVRRAAISVGGGVKNFV